MVSVATVMQQDKEMVEQLLARRQRSRSVYVDAKGSAPSSVERCATAARGAEASPSVLKIDLREEGSSQGRYVGE